MDDDIIRKYTKRVIRRAVIKSVLMGLVVALFAMFVTAAVLFLTSSDDLFWIDFVAFGAGVLVAVPLFYRFRYRPTEKDVAAAVDALGMEERAVTMVELKGSRSYISQKQREETSAALSSVPATAIKVTLSTALIVLIIVGCVLGLGLSTVNILVNADVMPGAERVADSIIADNTPTYTVEYESYSESETYAYGDGYVYVGDGFIRGESTQIVREGDSCTTVYAEADFDSVFVEWSDHVTTPERTDRKIMEDMEIYAVFALASEEDGGDEAGDGSGSEAGDSSAMGEEGSSDSGSPDQGDNDSENLGNGAGSGDDWNNNVDDNNTDYTTKKDEAMEGAYNDLNSGDKSYSQEGSDAVDGYFGSLFGGD